VSDVKKKTTEELLDDVRSRDDWTSGHELLQRRREPGLRAVLLADAGRLAPSNCTLAMIAGVLGGAEAKALLTRWMREAAARPEAFEPAKFCNDAAQDMTGPQNDEAASLVARAIAHPTAYNQLYAAMIVAPIYRDAIKGHLKTSALDVIEDALVALVRTKDKQVFTRAIPALLVSRSRKETARRCAKLLRDKDVAVRGSVLNALLEAPYRWDARWLADRIHVERDVTLRFL
jgi:hypothetical protein